MSYFYMSAASYTIVIPIICGLILYKHLPAYGRVLLSYLFLSILAELLSSYLGSAKINNMPVLHIYTVAQFLLIIWFFKEVFSSALISRYLYIIAVAFVLFAICNTLFIQSIYEFNSYSRSTEAIIIILICLYFFKQQLSKEIAWTKEPMTWFVLGFFIYFSSSLTIFIVSNVVLSLSIYFEWIMWNIHATIELIMYLLFTRGFIACKK